jgi:TRAP-type mannitol/chloroaromatic compound transport system permease large subunit
MLKAGYNIKVSAGCITAGGCLGILIPPSVLLIVYGATAGVSVVQLYAGAFFPGIMLAGLYLAYVIVLAKLKPALMPPLPESERRVPLPPVAQRLSQEGRGPIGSILFAIGGGARDVSRAGVAKELVVTLLPLLFVVSMLGITWNAATRATAVVDTSALDIGAAQSGESPDASGLQTPPEPPADASAGLAEPPTADTAAVAEPKRAETIAPATATAALTAPAAEVTPERLPVPTWFWILFAAGAAFLAIIYFLWTWERMQIFKMLLTSFFPLALLIIAVLGSIVFGFATPTEAAAVGAFGGFVLAAAYRFVAHWRKPPEPGARQSGPVLASARELGVILKESSFLTAKTSAMVCWLFVGSAIFSAAFALLGGQELVEKWVLSMDLTPLQFMVLAQAIIFILGWPLEWTEIIVIFMPIFIPLLPHFNVDPLFFGLLVALNLQTAFLSPPVAMAAFYLKGVAPRHVTLNQIFAGMMPFMVIQVIALVLLYAFPGIGLWLPQTLYK